VCSSATQQKEPSLPFSIYDSAIPPAVRTLENLSKILDKAVAQAKNENIDAKIYLEGRLASDMHPFTRQIQMASDGAKAGAARLAGEEPPSFPDTETSFPELKERITKTVTYLKSIPREKFAGADERTITLKFPNGSLDFVGRDFLTGFMLPNFYFHVTTAYDILRHKGVQIGKMDYLGGV
jgi:hypothetical protein